jgi:hypothetical protein
LAVVEDDYTDLLSRFVIERKGEGRRELPICFCSSGTGIVMTRCDSNAIFYMFHVSYGFHSFMMNTFAKMRGFCLGFRYPAERDMII